MQQANGWFQRNNTQVIEKVGERVPSILDLAVLETGKSRGQRLREEYSDLSPSTRRIVMESKLREIQTQIRRNTRRLVLCGFCKSPDCFWSYWVDGNENPVV